MAGDGPARTIFRPREGDQSMRIARPLALAGALLVTAAAMTGATTKTKDDTITCPIMHSKVAKSKAIKVTAANGKSTYVCCKSCVEAAKKQLMAKK
jgi:hypothetical protein